MAPANSLAVKAILDGNGIAGVTVSSVVDTDNGRVVSLFLASQKIHTLPPDIAKLTDLRLLALDHNELSSLPDEIDSLGRAVRPFGIG